MTKKKVLGLLVLIFIAFWMLYLFGALRSDDSKIERKMSAIPLLRHHADGLEVLVRATKKLDQDEVKGLFDPWGERIHAQYSNGLLILSSSGPDKEFDTEDDVQVERKIK